MRPILVSINKRFVKSESKWMELLRFGIVGMIATGIHYGIYLILLAYMKTNLAYSIGFAVSFIVNFFLSTYFTFLTKPSVKKGLGFGLSHAINYCMHIILLNLFIIIGVAKQYAPLAVFAIVIPLNFLLVRTILKSKQT
jgi:putative flippase GtrA